MGENAAAAQVPLLVLMKGHPGSGKSTLAGALARGLRWPLIDKDDVRDALLPLELPTPAPRSTDTTARASGRHSSAQLTDGLGPMPSDPLSCPDATTEKSSATEVEVFSNGGGVEQHPQASAGNPERQTAGVEASALNAASYRGMWNVAARQLALGLSVIVDCPLARRELFEAGVRLAHESGARVCIVECTVSDEAEWKRRVQERATQGIPGAQQRQATEEKQRPERAPQYKDVTTSAHGPSLKGVWHKPACWADVEALLNGYNGCWEYDTGPVQRLTLDTSSLTPPQLVKIATKWIRDILSTPSQ